MLLKAADRVCTLTNIGNMQTWMAERTHKWLTGQLLTPSELSEGHALVFKICSGPLHPRTSIICIVVLVVLRQKACRVLRQLVSFRMLYLTRCCVARI